MPIHERGKGFEVYVTHKGRRFRKTVATYDEAVDLEKRVKLDFISGLDPTSRIISETIRTNATMRDLYERTKQAAWLSPDSKPKANARLVLDAFNLWDVHPVDITPERLGDIKTALRHQGNSEATINRKIAALSKMFSVAVDLGWMERKPQGLKQSKERKGQIRYLTEQDERRLLETCKKIGNYALYYFVVFLIDTGARVSEALAVTERDITLQGVYLNTTKGGNPRLIPLTPRARDAALRWNNRHWTQDVVNDNWDRVREIIGELDNPAFTPHICRHTCASRLVMGGFDLRKVQAWLGHRSIATTLRYAHLMPDALAGGVELLERKIA